MAKDIESIEVSVNGTRETLNLRDSRVAGLDEALSKTQTLLTGNGRIPGAFEAVEETLFDLVDGKLGDYAKEIVAKWVRTSSLNRQYANSEKLLYFPLVDTSSVRNFSYAFYRSHLRLISTIDYSLAENMSYAFSESKLLKAPYINAPKCKSFEWTFAYCHYLKKVTGIDLSSATTVEGIFMACESLEYVELLDLSTVTSAHAMFYGCTKIESVHLSNTGGVRDFTSAFHGADMLNSVGTLDFASVESCASCFCDCRNLDVLRIKNFGTVEKIDLANAFRGATRWGRATYYDLPRQSLIDTFLTDSFDRTAAGYKPLVVQLEPQVLSVFSGEELAAITAKGFTLTSY